MSEKKVAVPYNTFEFVYDMRNRKWTRVEVFMWKDMVVKDKEPKK